VHLAAWSGTVDVDSLQLQEGDLRRQPTPEPGESSVARDHPVARNDDRDRVRPHRLADRSGHIGLADVLCDSTVRYDVPVLDLEQPVVDVALKARARPGEVERQVEARPLLREVLLELLDGGAKEWCAGFGRVYVRLPRQRTELYATDS
jgi:hypothetical protein